MKLIEKKALVKFFLLHILFVFSLLCFFYVFAFNVYAEDENSFEESNVVEVNTIKEVLESNSKYIDIQLFQENVQLDLPKNTASFWFSIPEGTVIGGENYLNLDMTVSDTLINERSSITLAVNGTTLETKWIHEITDNNQSWWKVNIPSEVMKIGELNEMSITTAQRSIEGDCADIDNPSNWVRFDPDSYFRIGIVQFGTPYLGNLYSFFYNSFNDKYGIQNEYVLPQNPDKTVLQGMLKVSSSIGAFNRNKNWISNKVSFREASDSSLKNKLFIGTVDNFTNSSILLLPYELYPEEGFLSVQNGNALISGKDEIGLDKAINFFSNISYLEQINETQLKVSSVVSENSAIDNNLNETGYYSFSDFKYDDVNLAGAFHQKATFTFKQPGGIESGDDSYINIRYHHSKALLSDNSLITIYLNNVPAGSEKLSNSNADGGSLKVKIPEKIRESELIEVRVEVYNYLGKIDCSKDFSDTAWTVIEKQSEIYLEPSDTGVYPTLTNFPCFGITTENNSITIGMPTDYDSDTLNIMSILSTKIGQVNGVTSDFTVCSESDGLTEDAKKGNMIFFGSFDDLWLPDEVGARLGILPLDDGFTIKENLAVTNETLSNKLIFQVMRSPWDFNKKIYVIMYDPSMKAYVDEFLSDTNKLNMLNDQISIVNQNGVVTNYLFGDNLSTQDNKVPLTWERIKYIIEKSVGLPIWLLLLALLLIIVNIFVLFKVLKKKGRFEKAAKDMGNTNEEINDSYLESDVTKSSISDYYLEGDITKNSIKEENSEDDFER